MPQEQPDHVAYVALGSNVGDRRATIQGALRALDETPGASVERISEIRWTSPVGGPSGQDDYLNAVVRLRTRLTAHELLDALMAIELWYGRERVVRWSARTLDLDLLLYDDATIETERLTVPHPRMHERRFVLEPLCDLAPDAVHPLLNMTARELLERL